MNRRKENSFTMYLTVRELSYKYEIQFKTVPYYWDYFTDFVGCIIRIQSLSEQTELNITGVATSKREKRELLAVKTYNLCVRAVAFFAHNNNVEMEKQVGYSLTDLRRKPDTVVVNVCRLINGIVKNELPGIEEFGITQVVLDEHTAVIGDYANAIGTPRVRLVERKSANEEIERVFNEANRKLKMMDKMMAMLQLDNPEAYNIYMGVREIIDLKGGRKKNSSIKEGVEGVISDFETGEPVVDAEVWTDKNPVKVKTDAEGYYIHANAKGETRMYVQKTGYPLYDELIEVDEGLILQNDIDLEKAEEPEG